jgi:hypothetical protein
MLGEVEGVFVINLAQRHDRRAWMTTTCLDALQVAFPSDALELSPCPSHPWTICSPSPRRVCSMQYRSTSSRSTRAS